MFGFDSYDKMKETSLPQRQHFESCVDNSYAKVAWEIIGCKTFADYHDILH